MKSNGEMDDMKRFAIIAASTAVLNIGAARSQAALADEGLPVEHAVEVPAARDDSASMMRHAA